MERARQSIGRHFIAIAVLCSLLPAGSAQAGPAPGTLLPAFQSAGNAFAESGGLVVFEAENYNSKVAGTNTSGTAPTSDSWTVNTTRPGAVGTAMIAGPDNTHTINTGYAPNVAPRMDYMINFTTLGTYYVWARGWGPDTDGDSIHIGLDGISTYPIHRMGDFYPPQPPAPAPPVLPYYFWIDTQMGGSPISIQVTTAGTHTFNLWMRQDGISIDRILLTTDANYSVFNADNSIPGPAVSGQSAAPPPTPTNLVGTPAPGQATLSWNPAAYATTYELYRSQITTPPNATTVPTVQGITATTYTDTGLTDGQAYLYWLRARNSVGASPWTSTYTSVMPPGPPPIPTGFTAMPGNMQVTLTWNLSAGAATYDVGISDVMGGNPTGFYTVTTGITAPPNTQSGTNLTAYYFVVRSRGPSSMGSQASAWSTEITATPGGAPSQPPPTMLFAQAGNNQVQLDWNPASGANTYNVLRGTTPGGPYGSPPLATGVAGIQYTDMTAMNGTTYYYVVQAVGPPGTSINSNEASATPFGVPAAPTNVVATAGDTQVFLSWTGSAGAGGYRVYQSDGAAGPPWNQIANNLTTNSYTVSSLSNGTQYFFVVEAFNTVGPSPLSTPPVSATPTTTPVPVPPIGLTAVAGDMQVSLSWNAVSGAQSYSVFRSTNPSGPYGPAIVTGVAGTTYTDTTVSNGTTYYYVVQAVNTNGNSGNSNEASATPSATPPPPPPPAPTGLIATAGNTVVGLNWNASTGATSYNVLIATVGGGPYTLVTGNVTGTSYTVTGLVNGTTYYFVVQAVSGAPQPSQNSNEASATPTGAPPPPTAPNITSATPLPSGTVGTPYSFTFQATGSTPITWTMIPPTAVPGLSLTGAVLSGNPTTANTYTFDIQAANGTAPNDVMTFTLTIAPMPATAPNITSPAILPPGTVGSAYSYGLTATGSPTINFTVVAGALPGGLNPTGPTGSMISGIPTTANTFTFDIQAANGTAPNDVMTFTLTINPAAAGAPVITSTSPLPAGTVGTPYTFTFTATGTAPITWSVVGGALPGGLTLSAGGVLSGTPTGAGPASFTVQAAGTGNTAGVFALTINAAPPPPPPPIPGAGSDGDEGGCGTSVPPPAMPWMWLLAGLSLLALGLGKGH